MVLERSELASLITGAGAKGTGSRVPAAVASYIALEESLRSDMSETAADCLLDEQELVLSDLEAATPTSCMDAILMLVPFVQQCLDREGRLQEDVSGAEALVVTALKGFIELTKERRDCLLNAA
jgi:hypothetical protein